MRSTLLGILVNLGLSAAKMSAGFVGHSFALVADGLESGADVLSGLVVFFGLKIAVKPPDKDHPLTRQAIERKKFWRTVVGVIAVLAAFAVAVCAISLIYRLT